MKSIRPPLLIALGSVVVTGTLVAGVPATASEIGDSLRFGVVDDATLASCLNQHLGQPAPYQQPITAAQLTSYGAHHDHDHDEAEHGGLAVRCEGSRRGAKIADLRGIEHLHHVEILNLNGNAITDIRPLAELTELKELWLMNNQIRDTQGIGALPDLLRANLSGNMISTLQPFASGNQIDSLDLSRNELTSIESIGELPRLQVLTLHNNHLSDLAPVQAFSALSTLYVDVNDVTDLAPLRALNLKILGASQNAVEDLEPLRGKPLQVLYLSENRISDLDPLRSLDDLMLLHLDSNRISDVSPLAALGDLSVLTLDDNQISDLSPLKTLSKASVRALSQQIVQPSLEMAADATSVESGGAPRDSAGEVVNVAAGSAAQIDSASGTVSWTHIGSNATSVQLDFESGDGTFSGTLSREIVRIAHVAPAVVREPIVPDARQPDETAVETPLPSPTGGDRAEETLASTGAAGSPLLLIAGLVLLALGVLAKRVRRVTLPQLPASRK
jgi:LPXTG-motif cell wall-anchored protein